MFQDRERRYVESARIGRLATADADGRPHVVPICFAFTTVDIVTPIDEKPQRVPPDALRRSKDIDENPRVALIIDHYTEEWSRLGWVQIRGRATRCKPDESGHSRGVRALRQKYDQYENHDLGDRPLIRISPQSVRSWGCLERPNRSTENEKVR